MKDEAAECERLGEVEFRHAERVAERNTPNCTPVLTERRGVVRGPTSPTAYCLVRPGRVSPVASANRSSKQQRMNSWHAA